MTLRVNEIFCSIQGESLFAGLPCVFVRLSGCNLRCTYCDTRYAYNEGVDMEFSDIINRIDAYGINLVEITGGEPLIQKETPDIITILLDNGYEVMLETNGSLDIGSVDNRCIKIVDIKCPGSGESDRNDFANLHKLTPHDQVKFVIGSREDYAYATELEKQIPCEFSRRNILFSPVFGVLDPAELAGWIVKDRLTVRLHLQLHKIIWPTAERGV